jgi:hypothetical protein
MTTTKKTGGKDTIKRIFYPGRYYVADTENRVVGFKTLEEAKAYAVDDDVVLCAISVPKTKRLDKIVLDFDKKCITLQGCGGKLNKLEFDEAGTYELDDEELKDFEALIADCIKCTKDFEIIGTPPVNGDLL